MVWLCSSIGFCSSDRLTIDRTGPKDHFTIPLAKCDKNNDVCSREYNALKYDHCDCVCGDHDATFSFYKQSWSCLGNKDTRRIFGKFYLFTLIQIDRCKVYRCIRRYVDI